MASPNPFEDDRLDSVTNFEYRKSAHLAATTKRLAHRHMCQYCCVVVSMCVSKNRIGWVHNYKWHRKFVCVGSLILLGVRGTSSGHLGDLCSSKSNKSKNA